MNIEEILTKYQQDSSISSQLPLMMGNGMQVTELDSSCNNCQIPFKKNNYHGTLTHVDNSHVLLDSIGHCPICNVYTPTMATIDSSSRKQFVITQHSRQQQEARWLKLNTPLTIKERIKTLL